VIRHFLVFTSIFLLVFTAGSGGDYRRTKSRTNDLAAPMLRTGDRFLATAALR